jgi:hypothetical protein
VTRALLVLTSTLLTLPALAADPIRPDQVLTPGRVLTQDTAKVCVPGYSATVRDTSAALKRRVFLAYGIEPRGSSAFEIDHRLPLSLGGADVAANLWPETRDRSVRENAWAKDKLESLVHRLVCIQHTMTLAAAQRLFLGDWIAAHRKLIGPL